MPFRTNLAALALTAAAAGAAPAAEIKVLSSNATKTLLEDIGPMFERASGVTPEQKARALKLLGAK